MLGGSTVLPAAVKIYCRAGSGSTVPRSQLRKHRSHPPPAVVPWYATVVPHAQESAGFDKREIKGLCNTNFKQTDTQERPQMKQLNHEQGPKDKHEEREDQTADQNLS